MSRLNGRKKVFVIGAVCALLAAAGAYAFWTSNGAGTGTAASESFEALDITQEPVTGLYPGGTAVPITGSIENTNAGAVTIGTITVALTSISGSSGTPACTTADYVLGSPTITINAVILGLATTDWVGPTIRMIDSATNQNACKNATLNLTYSSN